MSTTTWLYIHVLTLVAALILYMVWVILSEICNNQIPFRGVLRDKYLEIWPRWKILVFGPRDVAFSWWYLALVLPYGKRRFYRVKAWWV